MITYRTIATPNVELRLVWEHDTDYQNDVQDEHGNTCQETQAKLDSGEWTAFVFGVQVYINGRREGADYLCGSIYAEPREFFTTQGGGYLPDMVAEAIREARVNYNANRVTIKPARA